MNPNELIKMIMEMPDGEIKIDKLGLLNEYMKGFQTVTKSTPTEDGEEETYETVYSSDAYTGPFLKIFEDLEAMAKKKKDVEPIKKEVEDPDRLAMKDFENDKARFESDCATQRDKINDAKTALDLAEKALKESVQKFEHTVRAINFLENKIAQKIKKGDVVICVNNKGLEEWFEEGIEYKSVTDVISHTATILDMFNTERIVDAAHFKKAEPC